MLIFALAVACLTPQDVVLSPEQQALMDAMIQVESSGNDDAIGDGGNAIGCLQIWDMYWTDAVQYDKSIKGHYEDCFNRQYAIKVFDAYMRRYAKSAWTGKLDPERVARIHNGGPRGYRKKATLRYWAKVKKNLEG